MKKKRKMAIFLKILSIVYLLALIYFLFFSERYYRNSSEPHNYNLTPFAEIKRYLKYRSFFTEELFLVNIVGNVVGFIPLGVMIPLWVKKAKNFFLALVGIVFFSLCIETIQLVTSCGSFDVDDIILNSLGGLLGYIIYIVIIRRFTDAEGAGK